MTPFGVVFGLSATHAGASWAQASAFSVFVFAGSAQLAAVEVLSRGGGAAAAIVAGLLLNLRSLAFGIAMAPSLEGPWWKRAAWSHLMIDESTAVATAQDARRWRKWAFVYAGVAIFVAWNLSTLLGATALGSAAHLVHVTGIDATVPAAFVALLWPRLRRPEQRATAILAALVALALIPLAPAGIPVIAAGAAALFGWYRTAPRAAA